jgi:type VI secretion system protein ImpG
MSHPLEDYYDNELAVFGSQTDAARGQTPLAHDFARRYPAEAGRLIPDASRAADPHLDRFIEGFALLTGRLHHKLESEFPELSEALLQILYPHLLAPVPSMSIAQFSLPDGAGYQPAAIEIPQRTRLRTRPLGEDRRADAQTLASPIWWRTGYPVNLWPVQLTSAQMLRSFFPTGLLVPPRTQAALVLRLECLGPWRFADLPLGKLRYYLNGDRQVIANLYEVLFNHTQQVVFRSVGGRGSRDMFTLSPAECLFPVGFEPDEDLLPLPPESFPGYRILTEFLSFREKFLFLDLGGWRQAAQAGFGNKVEVVFFLNRAEDNLEQGVSARAFLAGCTPIINLFEKSAEPLAVTQRAMDYRVVPSRQHPLGTEVYSVDSVVGLDPAQGRATDFQPFYSFVADAPGTSRAEGTMAPAGHAFWYASRRSSYVEGDRGSEVYLTLVDSQFDPKLPAEGVLHVKTTCTNRDWPIRFQRGGAALYLAPGEGPATGPITCTCLHQPTAPLRPPLRRSTYWRLLAQNNLGHMSLTDPQNGLEAMREMLRLCDFSDPDVVPQLAIVNQKVIDGISRLACRPVAARVIQGSQVGSCRGLEVTLEFDERNFVGVGLFVFACVLERFLGLRAGLNTFSQLIAKTKQAEGYFKKWPPRAAHQQLH